MTSVGRLLKNSITQGRCGEFLSGSNVSSPEPVSKGRRMLRARYICRRRIGGKEKKKEIKDIRRQTLGWTTDVTDLG